MIRRNETVKYKAITSYGIILYTVTDDGQYLYLLSERRDSISYSEFIKDNLPDKLIPTHINLMSKEERERCLKYYSEDSFEELWKDLWTNHKNKIYKNDFNRCSIAFKRNMDKYLSYFEDGGGKVTNPWGFPKGRKNQNENFIDCALRELEEETSINKSLVKILNLRSFNEYYIGTDDKLYQSVYYLGYIDHIPKINIKYTPNNIRKTRISEEVSKLGWFSYGMACNLLDMDKKKILQAVNKILLFKYRQRIINHKSF